MIPGEIIVAPSILSADFSRLGEEVRAADKAGAGWIHIDVMDGHFVPNITVGPLVVRALRPVTSLPLDVHLMISDPGKYIGAFAEAGSDIITFHAESVETPEIIVEDIISRGLKAGISIKPATPADRIESLLPLVDMVLVMTVEPGFGGQEFMRDTLSKVRDLRGSGFSGFIQVDGGINRETSSEAIEAGADVLVAGTAVFGSDNYKEAIENIKGAEGPQKRR